MALSWLPNALSGLRILASLLLFCTDSSAKLWLYAICGASDVLDGALARILHAESRFGEQLDTAADMCFCAALARIMWWELSEHKLLLAVGAVALVKLLGAAARYHHSGSFSIPHSAANRILGIAVFLCGMCSLLNLLSVGMLRFVCLAAGAVGIAEIIQIYIENGNEKRNL